MASASPMKSPDRKWEEENFLHRVVESMGESVVVTDLRHRILYVNPAACRMLGYTSEELVGLPAGEIFEGVPGNPSDLAVTIQSQAKGETWEGSLFDRRKTGEVFPVRVNISRMRDERGEIVGFVGVSKDITEERRIDAEMRRTEKLASMGRMLSGAVHELSNPLSAIAGYAHLLLEGASGDLRCSAKSLCEETKRCIRIVENLLRFARKRKPTLRAVNLNMILGSVLELKGHTLKVGGVEIVSRLDPAPPLFLGDFFQIQQVFVNLIMNAHDAVEGMPEKRITVETGHDARFVRAVFSDTGRGIREELMERVFEPFFTTKEDGRGTGLGLSISYGIVKEHGGEIRISSREGGGTILAVEIPRQEALRG